MSTPQSPDAVAKGRRVLAERRARVARLRRRVAATGLSIFALAFALITQTGSLGSVGSATAASSIQSSASVTSSSTEDSAVTDDTQGFDDTQDLGDSSSSSSQDSEDTVSPVTTSQS